MNKKLLCYALIAYYTAFAILDIIWHLISKHYYYVFYDEIKNNKVNKSYNILSLFQLYTMRSVLIFLFLTIIFFIFFYRKKKLKVFYTLVGIVIVIWFIFSNFCAT